MRFTALDFETANADRSSTCAVGLAIVENGQIVGRLRQLIRPDPCRFDAFNVSIHGITEADVADAPTFQQFWPTLWSRVAGPLVAHNAAFDMSVLRYALDRSGTQYPETEYFCTRIIARLAWPQYPTYTLSYVANVLGITFQHHDAEEDAHACALVALAACKQFDVQSLDDLKDACGLRAGHLSGIGYSPCGGPYTPHTPGVQRAKLKASDITPSTSQIDEHHPYYGKSFVFTCTLMSMRREDAMQQVVDRGGICHDSVKQDTNYLVLGQEGYNGYYAGHKTAKMTKAEQMRLKGLPIEILSEHDFLSLL